MHTISSVVCASILLFLFTSPANAATKPPESERIDVSQLEQHLTTARGMTDADAAQQLARFELTERLSGERLVRLAATMPGEKSHQALLLLADQSAFLDPPAAELVADATPGPAATRQMLVQIVNYVNTTIRQLPNLIASRTIIGFEDRPQEDALEATGIVSYSFQPLHVVGKSVETITFRDRKELVDEHAGKGQDQGKIGGMITTGEFGPILSTVVADALKGKITWGRWEQRTAVRLAVFNYSVPDEKSNYRVKYCCVVGGYDSNRQPELQLFDERAGYHGEIEFDPANGTIYRMTIKAILPPHSLVSDAGVVVEYAPIEIGGKSYICPARSISILEAHTTQQRAMYSKANYQGPVKTFLNDAVFGEYRRFGSETRILTGENQTP